MAPLQIRLNQTKPNYYPNFISSDKKPGMQVSEKQKLSPWDILEGHKTPAPLSWTWFGAVKHERKPMRYEEGFHELKYASLGENITNY